MTLPFAAVCIIERDVDKGFVAWTPNLQGVVSQGESMEEALQNFREALEAALISYLSEGKTIPFFNTFAVSLVEVDVEKIAKEKKNAGRESE